MLVPVKDYVPIPTIGQVEHVTCVLQMKVPQGKKRKMMQTIQLLTTLVLCLTSTFKMVI